VRVLVRPLARLSGKGSRFSHFYDIVTDAVCDAAVLAGLGIELSTGPWGKLAIVMALIAGFSVAFSFYLIVAIDRDLGLGHGTFSAVAGFDPDDSMLIIPIAVGLGHGETLLLAAVILAPLAAVLVYLNFRSRRSAQSRNAKDEAAP
jgi:phosphatidylglycerophosphate synthase